MIIVSPALKTKVSKTYTKTDLASHIQMMRHFLSSSYLMSIPGGTLLWQIRAKDNASQRLVPMRIKQESPTKMTI